ncbi:MAG: excinuclease ABC subunit UvrA [bacterium]
MNLAIELKVSIRNNGGVFHLENFLKVSGARENNLKNIEIKIPHGKHTVITGVSGSGKSSLAYDVIFAAGQKRLLDCLSEQLRQFGSQIKQPEVDYIDGLTPVISLKQYKARLNPRATVGTTSEISRYLRYLYTTVAKATCPICHTSYPIRRTHQIVKELEKLANGTIVELQFPVYKSKDKKYDDFFAELRKNGHKKIVIDGERKDLRDWIKIDKEPQLMMVVANRIQVKEELIKSDIKAVEDALREGEGFIRIVIDDLEQRKNAESFYQKHGCIKHSFFTANILPSFFSFNNLESACEECHGTGYRKKAYPFLLVKNKRKSLKEGAFFKDIHNISKPFDYMMLYSLAKHFDFPFEEAFEDLPVFAKEIIFYGRKGDTFPLQRPGAYHKELPKYSPQVGDKIEFEGFVNKVNRLYRKSQGRELKDWEKGFFNKFMSNESCESCHGTRLKPQRQYITINANTYNQLEDIELNQLKSFIETLEVPFEKLEAVNPVLKELNARLNSLINIGLGYLCLNRRTDTLSGGEYQRLRLAGQIASGLMGLTYIIDEPTVGLHAMDNKKIIALLNQLSAKGNTVITIEHDLDLIKSADNIIEMGPGAGINGGEIIATGIVDDIIKNEKSVIASFLKNKKIETSQKEKNLLSGDTLKIIGAEANNLKNIDVSLPLNSLTCLTGISGSGKSSLAIEILYKAIWSSLHGPGVIPGKYKKIEGMEKIKDIYCIDQASIGSSSRSIPATYLGFFDRIRQLFANSNDAKKYGLIDKGYYSFNSKGGCSGCKGIGYLDTHIHYLGDLQTICPVCKGKRYHKDVLQVLYKDKTIAEVLDLGFEEALIFFKDNKYISHKLSFVNELGLGYMKLGQQTTSISGGEAQRLRLAKEISKIRGKGNMLYIMDEPSTGLHSKDIEKLLQAIQKLIDKGNSVLIIEHNLDIIRNANYIIDMGPGAGNNGGELVASGSLEDILNCSKSKTGEYLRSMCKEKHLISSYL